MSGAGFISVLSGVTKAVDLGANKSHVRFSISPNDAHAGFRVNSNGTMQGTAATSLNWGIADGTWLQIGANSDYEVRYTKTFGLDPDAGTLNIWMVLSTTRAISFSEAGIGDKEGHFNCEIRLASNGLLLSACTIVLNAIVEV